MTIPRWRRIAIAVTGVTAGAVLLRPQLADALVIRGDGYLYSSQLREALDEYRRATYLDADCESAVDRFAFFASTTRDRAALSEAVEMATAYLARHPGDAEVRMDRGMAYRRLGWTGKAMADLAQVGAEIGDPRVLTLAGYAAYDSGNVGYARRLWEAALRASPGFPAAVRALRRHAWAR